MVFFEMFRTAFMSDIISVSELLPAYFTSDPNLFLIEFILI